jgi:hypothetical protein
MPTPRHLLGMGMTVGDGPDGENGALCGDGEDGAC